MSGKLMYPLKFRGIVKSAAILLSILLLLITAFSLVACNSVIVPTPISKDVLSGENTIADQSAGSSCKVISLAISPPEINIGQAVTITADVFNSGNVEEIYQAKLKIDDNIEAMKNIVIPAGATQRINFQVSKDLPGNYLVAFGNLSGKLAIISKVTSLQTNSSDNQPGISSPNCCDTTNQTNNSSSSCCGTPPQQYVTPASPVRAGGSCCGN
jgi:hypothetical protein